LENQTLHQGLSDFVGIYKSAFPKFRNLEVLIEIDESINQFPIVAEALFIIIKETITNALFHGKASKIEISLICSNAKTNLVVSDNGCGFDVDDKLTGSGINVMKSIARSLNGNFLVESNKNNVTIIRVSIPLLVNERI
jgi:signal transduction histidine kinase